MSDVIEAHEGDPERLGKRRDEVAQPSPSLDALQASIEELRRQTRRDLVAQEHRFLAALANLARIVAGQSPDWKDLLTPALTAFARTLVLLVIRTGVGLVAIFTLIFLAQQTALLATQNDRIDIQSALAEAQRRSSLMFEVTSIYDTVAAEKKPSTDGSEKKSCGYIGDGQGNLNHVEYQCWSKEVDNGPEVFTPTKATIGRIAALTQALRPYRYLRIESDKESCLSAHLSAELGAAFDALAEFSYKAHPDASSNIPVNETTWLEYMSQSYGNKSKTQFLRFWIIQVVTFLREWSAVGISALPPISCNPTSPERGQILVALSAADVNIGRLMREGVVFRYADIPDANLGATTLDHLDLAYSRMPSAYFEGSTLNHSKLTDADLRDASFKGANLTETDMSGALLQVITKKSDWKINLFDADILPEDAHGVRFASTLSEPILFEAFCRSIQGIIPSETGKYFRSNHSLLIERRLLSDGRKPEYAVLMSVMTRGSFSHVFEKKKTGLGEDRIVEVKMLKDCPDYK